MNISAIKDKIDFSAYFAPVQKRLDAMEKRERQLVIGAVITAIIALLYAGIWEPIFTGLDNQRLQYQAQRQQLIWMKDTVQKIKSLQSSGSSSTARFADASTTSLVERSAQSMGVKSFIKKQSSDKKGVKINLEQANFDRVILWLDDMQQKYGIETTGIKIEHKGKSGAVDVRVTLERANQ